MLTHGAPLIFRTPFWVTYPDDNEIKFLIKPLSYRAIHTMLEHSLLDGEYSYITPYEELMTESIIDHKGLVGFDNISSVANFAPKALVTFVVNKITELSVITDEQLGSIGKMLDIYFEPKFQDSSFDCTTCKAKGMDKARACGFLPIEEREPTFKVHVGKNTFRQCPMSMLDYRVLNQVTTAFRLYSSNMLPEQGSIGDQTMFFVKTSQLFEQKQRAAEIAQSEQAK